MKYTIPYEDKIGLPHIDELILIELSTGEIVKKDNDLIGKVIVSGEYTLKNDDDSIMEFTHEIPVSLLVDDSNTVDPKIEYNNLEYEVVKGRGIELMFDLDVHLENREEKFQVEIDEKLDEVLKNRDDQFDEVNEAVQLLNEEEEEESDEAVEVVAEFEEDIVLEEEVDLDKVSEDERNNDDDILDDILDIDDHHDDDLLDLDDLDLPFDDDLDSVYKDDALEELIEVMEPMPEAIQPLVEPSSYVEKKPLQVKPTEMKETFDIGFISSTNDRYTTYKILLLEEDERIEDVLKERDLSMDLVDDGFTRDGQKYVLKIEDE